MSPTFSFGIIYYLVKNAFCCFLKITLLSMADCGFFLYCSLRFSAYSCKFSSFYTDLKLSSESELFSFFMRDFIFVKFELTLEVFLLPFGWGL